MPLGNKDKIISAVYDLAGSPDQYDAFMLELEEKLATMRADGKSGEAGAIMQHMSRAVSLIDMITPWRQESDADLHKALFQRMQATMAVDDAGNIVDANTAAKVLYDLVPGSNVKNLPISEDDLTCLYGHVRRKLHNPAGNNTPNDVLRFENRENGRPVLLRLELYIQNSTEHRFVIVRSSDIGWPSHLGPVLSDLFDLSRAEIEVIRLLIEGLKVKEIAVRRRASTTTVRSQLQSIFSKTQTKDQMDCVRMVFGLALMYDEDEGNLLAVRIEAAQQTAFFPREDQRHLRKLPDGRQIEYSDFGAQTGPVILWYHDQAFGDVWFKEPVQLARKKGLRIIGPLRPGFGQTTVYPGRSSEPRDFARDVRWLLDDMGIDQVALVSSSSGLVHGLALAGLIPDRMTSITACHPLLPILCDDDLEGTNGYNYLLPHARLHFPASVKFLCKAGFAFVMRSGPGAFGKAVMRASPRDVEWISRPDILPVMIHGRRVHRDQGYVGNFGDLSYREDWRPLLINCPVPVRLVIGEHDRNVQWAAARRWSVALDHVDLHVLPDSGYMVFHQQFGQIINWVQTDLKNASKV